jgi:hypothetical protein
MIDNTAIVASRRLSPFAPESHSTTNVHTSTSINSGETDQILTESLAMTGGPTPTSIDAFAQTCNVTTDSYNTADIFFGERGFEGINYDTLLGERGINYDTFFGERGYEGINYDTSTAQYSSVPHF